MNITIDSIVRSTLIPSLPPGKVIVIDITGSCIVEHTYSDKYGTGHTYSYPRISELVLDVSCPLCGSTDVHLDKTCDADMPWDCLNCGAFFETPEPKEKSI
jgi:hypothetical protein